MSGDLTSTRARPFLTQTETTRRRFRSTAHLVYCSTVGCLDSGHVYYSLHKRDFINDAAFLPKAESSDTARGCCLTNQMASLPSVRKGRLSIDISRLLFY